MRKIFQSLGEHKGAIFLIVLLLIVECLVISPAAVHTDIVDGIQQGGIENAAPDEIRGSTFDSLSVFADPGRDQNIFTNITVEFPRRLPAILSIPSRPKRRENIEELNDIFGVPMVMFLIQHRSRTVLRTPAALKIPQVSQKTCRASSLEQLASLRAAGQLDDETVVKIREEAIQQMGDMSDSIISQMALAFVRQGIRRDRRGYRRASDLPTSSVPAA